MNSTRLRSSCAAIALMIPLLGDAFFVNMAMAGLAVATVVTLLVVPVLFAPFFRVRAPRN